jgi:hypothetical protein
MNAIISTYNKNTYYYLRVKHVQCVHYVRVKCRLHFYCILQPTWWLALVVTWIEVHITVAQLDAWPPKLLPTNEAAHLWAMCLALHEGEWVATPILNKEVDVFTGSWSIHWLASEAL